MSDLILPAFAKKLEPTSDGGFVHYYRDDANDRIYDVVILWRLSESFATFNIPAGDFDQFLEHPTAWSDGAPINSELKGEHWDRILEADLAHPILIRRRQEKMIMVDGYHRLMRARLDGEPFIRARDVSALLEKARIE